MSRIDDLIAEYCADGVEFSSLGDVAALHRGTAITERETTDGDVPVVANGPVPTYFHGVKNRIGETIVVARSGAYAGLVSYWNQPIFLTDAFSIHPDPNTLGPKYLFYLLQNQQNTIHAMKKGSGVPHVRVKDFETIRIPVPPLEVQREIVRILDTFAELEAELEARKRQYAHYRDSLLIDTGGHPFAFLSDVSRNLDSKRKPVTKSARSPGEIPYYGASGIVDYVSDYIFDGGYLLVSEDGANLIARSTPIAFPASGKTWINNHAHVLSFKSYTEQRFVEIYLNSIDLRPFLTGSAQPKLNKANLDKIPIPSPPLAEQERIVSVLDAFDALVNDLSIGLPAELVARRKQYEYYRDRLLTFEEKTA